MGVSVVLFAFLGSFPPAMHRSKALDRDRQGNERQADQRDGRPLHDICNNAHFGLSLVQVNRHFYWSRAG